MDSQAGLLHAECRGGIAQPCDYSLFCECVCVCEWVCVGVCLGTVGLLIQLNEPVRVIKALGSEEGKLIILTITV